MKYPSLTSRRPSYLVSRVAPINVEFGLCGGKAEHILKMHVWGFFEQVVLLTAWYCRSQERNTGRLDEGEEDMCPGSQGVEFHSAVT